VHIDLDGLANLIWQSFVDHLTELPSTAARSGHDFLEVRIAAATFKGASPTEFDELVATLERVQAVAGRPRGINGRLTSLRSPRTSDLLTARSASPTAHLACPTHCKKRN